MTAGHLTDIELPHRGIRLLPTSYLASGCTATLLSFCWLNGPTVFKHALYEKNECKKTMPKNFNGFEPATSRESPRIDLNWCAAQLKTA